MLKCKNNVICSESSQKWSDFKVDLQFYPAYKEKNDKIVFDFTTYVNAHFFVSFVFLFAFDFP